MSLDFSHEREKMLQGVKTIAGVDEVGRGPWAGPVVTCAVVLSEESLPFLTELNDSKKLSAKKREKLFSVLEDLQAKGLIQVNLAESSVEEIDAINIREATHLAMKRAVEGLATKPDFTFIDGHEIPNAFPTNAKCVIKGDGEVLSIAAASIIAKVTRDRLMTDLHQEFPQYNWAKNAGYGTKDHQAGLATHGITKYHRKSFKPIAALVG